MLMTTHEALPLKHNNNSILDCIIDTTLLRSGGNYHHSMFHNPTAAVNLFHVGKQYLTFCKAEAAVTHNVIGRKIISNVKHSDARNSLPILDVIRSSHKMPYRATVRQSTANERYVKRQMSVIRIYTCSERHLTFRRNIDTRRQWSVGNIPDEMSGYIGRLLSMATAMGVYIDT